MRLVIHAGFGKCGSSSIQQALQNAEAGLKRRSIFLFGKDLVLGSPSGYPFWKAMEALGDMRQQPDIAPRILRELERVSRHAPNATAILSAELLARKGLERPFITIDQNIDTTVVFYFRPQFEWIPSAWKQWRLKQGIPLQDFAAKCLASNRPDFRKAVERWSSALPKAKVILRVLPQAIAEAGGPAEDFLKILGAGPELAEHSNSPLNPSVDYAILHALNKNPWLFEKTSETRLFRSLAEILPEQYLKTNIKMLSFETEERIAAHFRLENEHLLKSFVGLDEPAAERVYNSYFRPREASRPYVDLDDIEVAYRCFGILIEALIHNHERHGGRKTILRPPYWKVPWRIAKRLAGR